MLCPICAGKVRVIDNVKNPFENEIYRKKVCLNCNHEFFTVEYEVIVNERFEKDWNEHYRKRAEGNF